MHIKIWVMNAAKLRRPVITAFLLLTALFFILIATSCKINPTPPNRYALVYGISIYNEKNPENDGDGPNLVWTDNDAVDMARLFQNKGYKVRLRVNDGTTDLLSTTEKTKFNLKKVTKKQFLDDMADYGQNLSVDDLFVFYFSGHGTNS